MRVQALNPTWVNWQGAEGAQQQQQQRLEERAKGNTGRGLKLVSNRPSVVDAESRLLVGNPCDMYALDAAVLKLSS